MKSKRNKSLHGLGRLQAEVLEIVWDCGEVTVAQARTQICKQRQVTYTTVLVALQKLEKKGWLTHRRDGRANVYRSKRTREAAHAPLLKELLKQAFLGDPRLLVSHLLDEHPMSDEELADLRNLIEGRRKENRRE